MTTERQSPDAILEQTELSGAVSNIQDDPDSPDANWITASGNGASVLRVSFPTPTGNPTTGVDLQNFRAQVRKSASGGNDVSVSLQFYENGSLVTETTGFTVTSTTGQVISHAWDASSLGTADGSLVECRLEQTGGHTGKGSNRRYMEVGAVEWNVDYTALQNYTLTAESGSYSVSGTAAGLLYDRNLTALSGSSLIGGTAANLEYHRVFPAESGSVAITGTDATLSVVIVYTLTAEGGSLSVTGTPVAFLYDRSLAAGSGAVTISGTDISPLYNRIAVLSGGAFVITGADATLKYNTGGGNPYQKQCRVGMVAMLRGGM